MDEYPGYEQLPVEDRDEDFDYLLDVLFEDDDVLMLFDPALDGIEDSDIGAMMDVVYLHPRDWFKPFRQDNTSRVA